MIRKIGPDDFAKGMMFLAIFIAGILLGAATGGWSNLQGWISALSGWFAGGAAIWIGLTQLGPLLAEMQQKKQTNAVERIQLAREVDLNLSSQIDEMANYFFRYKMEQPAVNFALFKAADPLERNQSVQDEIFAFLKVVDKISREQSRLLRYADEIPAVSQKRNNLRLKTTELYLHLYKLFSEIGERGLEANVIKSHENQIRFFKSLGEKGCFERIEAAGSAVINAVHEFRMSMSEEIYRLEQKLLSESDHRRSPSADG